MSAVGIFQRLFQHIHYVAKTKTTKKDFSAVAFPRTTLLQLKCCLVPKTDPNSMHTESATRISGQLLAKTRKWEFRKVSQLKKHVQNLWASPYLSLFPTKTRQMAETDRFGNISFFFLFSTKITVKARVWEHGLQVLAGASSTLRICGSSSGSRVMNSKHGAG